MCWILSVSEGKFEVEGKSSSEDWLGEGGVPEDTIGDLDNDVLLETKEGTSFTKCPDWIEEISDQLECCRVDNISESVWDWW